MADPVQPLEYETGLLQENFWKVITYTSRSLSDVERRYSQVEKETLWASDLISLCVDSPLRWKLTISH